MKSFNLIRNGNIITEGVIFHNGQVCMKWLGDISSIVIHDNIENVIKIHTSVILNTEIVYLN